MIVYKVVRNKKGKLKSALSRCSPDGSQIEYAQLTYKPGEVTKPEFGKIFAFSSLRDAVRFSTRSCVSHQEIWEAETPEAERIDSVASDGGYSFAVLARFKAFWESGLDYVVMHMPAPPGTVVCPEITLIEKCSVL